jgi:hypothetical protein
MFFYCPKHFNLLDLYIGNPPSLPKARSKMESLILIYNPIRDLLAISSIFEGRYNLNENPELHFALQTCVSYLLTST